MAVSDKQEEEKQAWRFYRSSLSTIVWNPKTDSLLADFTEGHFTTDDPVVAKKLRELGYMEIPIDAIEPPSNIIIREVTPTINGDVPILQGNETSGKINIPVKPRVRLQSRGNKDGD